MKKIILLVITLCLLLIVLAGCNYKLNPSSVASISEQSPSANGSESQPAPTVKLNYTAFLELLEANGLMFEESENFFVGYMGANARAVRIGDETLIVYKYDTNEEMEYSASNIDRSGTSIMRSWSRNDGSHSSGVEITWATPPYWFKKDLIIVLYSGGEDQRIIEFLKEIFGDNFAGYGRW